MNDNPVVFSVAPPERFDRLQSVLRLVILAALSMVGTTLGAIAGLLYLLLPVFAAVVISQKGGRAYLQHDGLRVASVLRFVVGVYAYFALVTDKLPTGGAGDPVQFVVNPSGSPTLGSALMRFLTSIPAMMVLALLGIVAWFVLIVAAIMIVTPGHYPPGLFHFPCTVLPLRVYVAAYEKLASRSVSAFGSATMRMLLGNSNPVTSSVSIDGQTKSWLRSRSWANDTTVSPSPPQKL